MCPRTVVSVSYHNKNPTKRVDLVQSRPHHHHLIKINFFSPWYSWKIAELALNNNHSLTRISPCSIVLFGNWHQTKCMYGFRLKMGTRLKWTDVLSHFRTIKWHTIQLKLSIINPMSSTWIGDHGEKMSCPRNRFPINFNWQAYVYIFPAVKHTTYV